MDRENISFSFLCLSFKENCYEKIRVKDSFLSSMALVQAEVKCLPSHSHLGPLASASLILLLMLPLQIEIKMSHRAFFIHNLGVFCAVVIEVKQLCLSLLDFYNLGHYVCCSAHKSQQQPSDYLSILHLTRI